MMPNKSSKHPFIVIEALDAGGSQTQTDLLTSRLRREKINTLQLHFPHEDRATGRLIYDKFLHNHNRHNFSKREQALLYIQDFYSRNEDIIDHLKSGDQRAVVSDRYCTSTYAYQTIGLAGRARKNMINWLNWLCYEKEPHLHRPDAVIFLDTPVETSLQRLSSKKNDYFENKQKLTAIRNSYLKIAHEQKWHVLDSMNTNNQERTRADLHRAIWQLVAPLLH
ncbi:MAG: dTMP kinase [Candidatus Curtissbacteria bacterium]|nr:dTMP kinase [bacterium]MDZ4209932.1 dTMP kinase [Candidatus Curtissbacteria bacterium]